MPYIDGHPTMLELEARYDGPIPREMKRGAQERAAQGMPLRDDLPPTLNDAGDEKAGL